MYIIRLMIPKLTKKQRKKFEARGQLRDQFELWVDLHNHKLEFIRTLVSCAGAVLSALIFAKVFGIFK